MVRTLSNGTKWLQLRSPGQKTAMSILGRIGTGVLNN